MARNGHIEVVNRWKNPFLVLKIIFGRLFGRRYGT